MGDKPSLSIGTRIQYGQSRGFVRYVGRIDGKGDTQWVGVEWDDSTRGNHCGSVNGKQYFTCVNHGSGSFVKADKLANGDRKSLLQAVRQRYLGDALDTSYKDDHHVVGGGEVQISTREFTPDDYALQKLQIVDVSGLGVAFLEDGDGEQMRSIQELRIGKSLFTKSDVLLRVIEQFMNLRVLDASRNVFGQLDNVKDCDNLRGLNMKVLILNHCVIKWDDVMGVCKAVPNLDELRLHNCAIGSLQSAAVNGEQFAELLPKLRLLDMDSNHLCWKHIIEYIGRLRNLQELYLSNNGLEDTTLLQDVRASAEMFGTLEILSLSNNNIEDWNIISSLNQLERLHSLRIRETPITSEEGVTAHKHLTARMRIIGRMKHLRQLDGSTISADERVYAEKRYLEYECRTSTAERHPRKSELEELYEGTLAVRKRTSWLRAELIHVAMQYEEDTLVREVWRDVPRRTRVGRVLRLAQRLLRAEGELQRWVGWREVDENEQRRELGYWVGAHETSIVIKLVLKSDEKQR